MKAAMLLARVELGRLLERNPLTRGMYVRIHGDHLILGREEVTTRNRNCKLVDVVRMTHLGGSTYGLSVKRHTGRWERTPFHGSMSEMVHTIGTCMQHLIAPPEGCTGTFGSLH